MTLGSVIALVVLAFIAIPLVIGTIANLDNPPADTSGTEAGTAQTETTQPANQWVEVFRFENKGPRNTEPFQVGSARQRIRFKADNSELQGAPFYVYIVPEGRESGDDALSVDTPAEGENQLYQRPGRYYLKIITGPSTSYSLIFEELR